MRALTYEGPFRVAVRKKPEPRIERPQDAIVRVTSAAIDPEHKPMPPVYGTAVPLHGLSGLVRRAAYRYPDHWMRHWTLLLFADRVAAWTTRTRRVLKVLVPAAALLMIARRMVAARG